MIDYGMLGCRAGIFLHQEIQMIGVHMEGVSVKLNGSFCSGVLLDQFVE